MSGEGLLFGEVDICHATASETAKQSEFADAAVAEVSFRTVLFFAHGYPGDDCSPVA